MWQLTVRRAASEQTSLFTRAAIGGGTVRRGRVIKSPTVVPAGRFTVRPSSKVIVMSDRFNLESQVLR